MTEDYDEENDSVYEDDENATVSQLQLEYEGSVISGNILGTFSEPSYIQGMDTEEPGMTSNSYSMQSMESASAGFFSIADVCVLATMYNFRGQG